MLWNRQRTTNKVNATFLRKYLLVVMIRYGATHKKNKDFGIDFSLKPEWSPIRELATPTGA